MPAAIHATAIVERGAELGTDVDIGPFCVVGGDAVISDGVKLVSHISIAGLTHIGPGTTVYPFASLGHPPQDLKYRGEASRLEIGGGCTIREHVTMNPGTEGGGMLTRIGDNGLFMVGAHVAHDCRIGDHVIMANNATLGGHVTVGDYAIIGGLAAVHQFVRIGEHAMIGGMSGVEHDVIPYGLVKGDRARLAGLNTIGLKRRGHDRRTIGRLQQVYAALFGPQGTFAERLAEARSMANGDSLADRLLKFAEADASRPLCQPK